MTSSSAGPEMISGVRASSMRMLSTSSMIAKFSGPCACCWCLRIAVVAAGGELHVVAQVVEAELVVRAVGDVAGVGLLPLGRVHVALDGADGQAQARVDRAHPFHVAAGEVVVDRDDVDALAVERVEIGGQRGDERLAFAGDHLGDVAAVQDHAADDLHVVVPHAEEPAARLAAGGEGFDQEVVERLARVQPPAELGGLRLRARRRSSPGTSASSALIASTLGCSFLMNRALAEPNSDGDRPLEPAEDAVADRRRRFPKCVPEFP